MSSSIGDDGASPSHFVIGRLSAGTASRSLANCAVQMLVRAGRIVLFNHHACTIANDLPANTSQMLLIQSSHGSHLGARVPLKKRQISILMIPACIWAVDADKTCLPINMIYRLWLAFSAETQLNVACGGDKDKMGYQLQCVCMFVADAQLSQARHVSITTGSTPPSAVEGVTG